MIRFYLLSFVFLVQISYAQDSYHSNLINSIEENFGAVSPEFTLYDNEQSIVDGIYIYGDAAKINMNISDQDWSISINYAVNSVGANPWDAGTGIRNLASIAKDDVVLITFYGRKLSDNTLVSIFAEHRTTFAKEVFFDIEFTDEWQQYLIPFTASEDFPVDGMTFGFHLASAVQEFELAGFTVLNYKTVISESGFDSSFSPAKYEGHEEDAAWRAAATTRIDDIRKSDLTIKIVDLNDNPVPNTEVRVAMQNHLFGWGSAVVPSRFSGNRNPNSTYVEKLTDLDGQGHGFNEVVTENALKWNGWEEEWIATPEQTVSAIEYLNEQNIEVRGHTLIWPGFSNMPSDIQSNQSDINYVLSRIDDRISEMITHPQLSSLVTEWDVLNEITVNHDLENLFKGNNGYESGREIYQYIFQKINELNPDQKIYVNEYVTLSGGGSGTATIDRFKLYLDELAASERPFDGIGFQCHIGQFPTSLIQVEETFRDFSDRYGVPMKITEFDMHPGLDEEVQVKYFNDFLTMIYSLPNVESFIMWGFWDGNQWGQGTGQPNAPLFNLDWSLKPTGQVFIDKVFNEWWTDEIITTDAEGMATISGFHGEYSISLEGTNVDTSLILSSDLDANLTLDISSSTTNLIEDKFQISPNPIADHSFQINFAPEIRDVQADLFNINGMLVDQFYDINSGEKLSLDKKISGLHILRIKTNQGIRSSKLFIQD